MAAPAFPPIRLELIGTGLAVERLDVHSHHLVHTRTTSSPPFAA
jgi:hypothetical protein